MYESVACYNHRKGSKKEQDIENRFFLTYFKSANDFSKLRRVKSYP
jgi:hypothetical protein